MNSLPDSPMPSAPLNGSVVEGLVVAQPARQKNPGPPFDQTWWSFMSAHIGLGIIEKSLYLHLCNLARFRRWVKVDFTEWGRWFDSSRQLVRRAFIRMEAEKWIEADVHVRGRSPRFRPLLHPQTGAKIAENSQIVPAENSQFDTSQNSQFDTSHTGTRRVEEKESIEEKEKALPGTLVASGPSHLLRHAPAPVLTSSTNIRAYALGDSAELPEPSQVPNPKPEPKPLKKQEQLHAVAIPKSESLPACQGRSSQSLSGTKAEPKAVPSVQAVPRGEAPSHPTGQPSSVQPAQASQSVPAGQPSILVQPAALRQPATNGHSAQPAQPAVSKPCKPVPPFRPATPRQSPTFPQDVELTLILGVEGHAWLRATLQAFGYSWAFKRNRDVCLSFCQRYGGEALEPVFDKARRRRAISSQPALLHNMFENGLTHDEEERLETEGVI